MATEQALTEAVQSGIVAAAYLSAFERVSAAAETCSRLGRLTSGRWRSAARDLEQMRDELERGLEQVTEDVARRAGKLDVPVEAFWTAGDAAGLYDLFREDALEELESDSAAARLLQTDVLFGATFLDDPDVPNRGTTLLFGWVDPLFPATWSWEGNWIAAEEGEEDSDEEELDLSEVTGLQTGEPLLEEVQRRLEVTPDQAEDALIQVASALTRVSLLTALSDEEELESDTEDASSNGHSPA